MLRRALVILPLSLTAACGGSDGPAPACTTDDSRLPKAFFVGDVATEGDEPSFALIMTVVEATFAGEANGFVGATMPWQVTAEIAHDYLIFHDAQADRVASVFFVESHEDAPCSESESSTSPWSERPWLRVDLSADLVNDMYAFDAASTAGHPEAIDYEPLDFFVPAAPEQALDDGYLAFEVGSQVTWSDIDADTLGCAYDLPDFAGSECPVGELRIRYELQR